MNSLLDSKLGWLMLGLIVLPAGIDGAAATETVFTRTPVQVEHIQLVSKKSFDEVASALERTIPELDPGVVPALDAGDEKHAMELEKGGKLFIFLKRYPGELLRAVGHPAKARQYEIGNPITAMRMTQHQLSAGLYAPLRVLLVANAAGGATFEYDRPSSLFGQFGDAEVTAVGRELDSELEEALQHAAQ